jgi:hypothetical protein
MRRLALVLTLACVLSGVVRAGEIHTTGAVASPSPTPVPATGQIPTNDETPPGEIHSTGETVLTIILTIISIVP